MLAAQKYEPDRRSVKQRRNPHSARTGQRNEPQISQMTQITPPQIRGTVEICRSSSSFFMQKISQIFFSRVKSDPASRDSRGAGSQWLAAVLVTQ